MAIEIVDFPIKNGGSFHCYVSSPECKPLKLVHCLQPVVIGRDQQWTSIISWACQSHPLSDSLGQLPQVMNSYFFRILKETQGPPKKPQKHQRFVIDSTCATVTGGHRASIFRRWQSNAPSGGALCHRGGGPGAQTECSVSLVMS